MEKIFKLINCIYLKNNNDYYMFNKNIFLVNGMFRIVNNEINIGIFNINNNKVFSCKCELSYVNVQTKNDIVSLSLKLFLCGGSGGDCDPENNTKNENEMDIVLYNFNNLPFTIDDFSAALFYLSFNSKFIFFLWVCFILFPFQQQRFKKLYSFYYYNDQQITNFHSVHEFKLGGGDKLKCKYKLQLKTNNLFLNKLKASPFEISKLKILLHNQGTITYEFFLIVNEKQIKVGELDLFMSNQLQVNENQNIYFNPTNCLKQHDGLGKEFELRKYLCNNIMKKYRNQSFLS